MISLYGFPAAPSVEGSSSLSSRVQFEELLLLLFLEEGSCRLARLRDTKSLFPLFMEESRSSCFGTAVSNSSFTGTLRSTVAVLPSSPSSFFNLIN